MRWYGSSFGLENTSLSEKEKQQQKRTGIYYSSPKQGLQMSKVFYQTLVLQPEPACERLKRTKP